MLSYAEKHRPLWLCGENVSNMLRAAADMMSNFQFARRNLRRIGYTVFWAITCASKDGLPHTRERLDYWCFFSAGCAWFVCAEHTLVMSVIAAIFEQCSNTEQYSVEAFALPETTASQRFVSTNFALPEDNAKWPSVHLQWGEDSKVKVPVTDGAYNVAPAVLAAMWPQVSLLPDREQCLLKCMDKVHCKPSGSGRTSSGEKVFLNLSQAVNRDVATIGGLGCIHPGAKFIDLEAGTIIHGATLMRLQCIASSLDYELDFFSFSEKLLADMGGNACNGLSYAKALVASFATSVTAPKYRITRVRKAAGDIEEKLAQKLAKRCKPDSGLGALLGLDL